MEKESRICVVGSNGMLGHAICKQLKKSGYCNIISCDREQVDLCNQKDTYAFFEKEKPEYVFFLAAIAAGIQYKRDHPTEMLLGNLQMITNVMEASKRVACKKMINVCSALLYPNAAKMPLAEDEATYVDLGQIDTPYSLAKAAGMQLARYYNSEFYMDYLTVVPCNFFGEFAPFDGDRAGVVPSLIRRIYTAKLNNDESVVVWGTGNACRELLNSEDVADACIFLMNRPEEFDLINIGRGKEFTIKQVAEEIKNIIGYNGKLIFDASKPEGRKHMKLNTERLFSLGWHPSLSLHDSILKTYNWYLQNINK